MTSEGATTGGPTARRLVLGSQLRRLRETNDISREDAGHAIRGSGSKISRLELGRVGFKQRDVSDLLTLYGDLDPTWFQDYVGLEESASRIQTHELQFIPGLLQTESYARTVASRGRPEATSDEVDQRVLLRMQRQQLLSQSRAPRLWAVVDEAVLYRPFGDRAALRAQIEHLLEITQQSNISLQVTPFELTRPSAEGAFTILRFGEPELPDIVYLEHLCGALYLDKSEEVELYSKASHRLAIDARTPEESRKALHEARQQL